MIGRYLSAIVLSTLCGATAAAQQAPQPDPPPGSAALIMKAYDQGDPNVRIAAEMTIFGAAEGLAWANAELSHHKEPRLYCQPEKLAITKDEAMNIFQKAVSDHPTDADEPFGFVMMRALEETFPCGNSH